MEQIELIKKTAALLNLTEKQVTAVSSLAADGCTIAFIARYRKEQTDNLDEIAINEIQLTHEKLTAIEKRREYIINFLETEKKLTTELKGKLLQAQTLLELEDIYLPFKPRKKTRADKAIEAGLQSLADYILLTNPDSKQALLHAKKFINDSIESAEQAMEGALDILVQKISDSADARKQLRNSMSMGTFLCSIKRGKKETAAKYKDYFDYSEPLQKLPAHRIMATLRGEHEGFLNLSITPNRDIDSLALDLSKLTFNKTGELLKKAAVESCERHLLPSITKDLLKNLRAKAEQDSVVIFAKNLERILLAAPFGEKAVIGIDPGIRTGCKAAAIDQNGNYLDFTTLYLHKNPEEIKKLNPWLEKYSIQGIAIGDGTYGKETYSLVKELCKQTDIVPTMVDEDGASVYSASTIARDEFPKLDVTVKGAISIARRFQDPLAELVKIDPKSLGVGQYQHDISTSLLQDYLTKTVEWAVNKVGVNINTAGYHLLAYISGLDKKRAKEIVTYRSEHKIINNRNELKKIKGIGAKAFEQSAGFLRIYNGSNPLDTTGVHPESYQTVTSLADSCQVAVADLVNNPAIIKTTDLPSQLNVPQLDSILQELTSRGLDPRKEFTVNHFSDEVQAFDDLKPGMIIQGVIDNVAAFGAFIDLGIKENGLVHISEVSSEYITDINSVLAIGDAVTVKVIGLDTERKRIQLSIKQVNN